eukprot:gene11873-20189_t
MIPVQCNLLRQYVRDNVRITQRRGELYSLIDSIEARDPIQVIRELASLASPDMMDINKYT